MTLSRSAIRTRSAARRRSLSGIIGEGDVRTDGPAAVLDRHAYQVAHLSSASPFRAALGVAGPEAEIGNGT